MTGGPHGVNRPEFDWMAQRENGTAKWGQVFQIAELQYFYSSVAMTLFRSLFNFASFGNSFSSAPISRITVRCATMAELLFPGGSGLGWEGTGRGR